MSAGSHGTPPPALAIRTSRPGDEGRLREIMLAVLATDAPPGTTAADVEHTIARLPGNYPGTLVSLEDAVIAGYVTPDGDDLSVDPAFRRRGHGRALVEASRALVRSRGLDRLRLWVPPDGAGREFAEALGFRYESSLWLLRLPDSIGVPSPDFGGEVSVRAVEPGVDEPGVANLINTCFADHPSPLTVTVEAIRHTQRLATFNPGDVLLVAPRDRPADLIGFCRTEVLTGAGERRGDIRLLGVVPSWRGRGLGRELLRWGVAHLRSRRVDVVDLAVEARNERALRLYLETGFERAIEWPHWTMPA